MTDFPIKLREGTRAESLAAAFLTASGRLSDPFQEAMEAAKWAVEPRVEGASDYAIRQSTQIPKSLGVWAKGAYATAFPGGALRLRERPKAAIYLFDLEKATLFAKEEGVIVEWGWARGGAPVERGDRASFEEKERLLDGLIRLGASLAFACQTPGWADSVEGEGDTAHALSLQASFFERIMQPAASLAPALKARSEAAELAGLSAAEPGRPRALRV